MKTGKTAIIIPARLASKRLPRKLLFADTGKYLVQHTYEQAIKTRAATVIVACDSDEISAACDTFGAPWVMTDTALPSGTDRVAAAARGIDADIIVNLQCDEPEIDPVDLDALMDAMTADPACLMGTLAIAGNGKAAYVDPNVVKVVVDSEGFAVYFSRAPIPYPRDGYSGEFSFLKHIGVYAYRRDFLFEYSSWKPSELESTEKLEQLRAVDRGVKIKVVYARNDTTGIDTAADYEEFVRRYSEKDK